MGCFKTFTSELTDALIDVIDTPSLSRELRVPVLNYRALVSGRRSPAASSTPDGTVPIQNRDIPALISVEAGNKAGVIVCGSGPPKHSITIKAVKENIDEVENWPPKDKQLVSDELLVEGSERVSQLFSIPQRCPAIEDIQKLSLQPQLAQVMVGFGQELT